MLQAMSESGSRFTVVTMSEKFFQLTGDMPELSTAPWIQVGMEQIDGATVILETKSLIEIEQQLPEIARKVPNGHRLVMIKYSQVGEVGVGTRFVLDLSKIPKN